MGEPRGAPVSAVEVVRGGVVEARHAVHVVVVDAGGRRVAGLGDPSLVTFLRSAAKPLQALPLVEEGVTERFGLTRKELALCCASHEGEESHVRGVRSILSKAGVDESALRCGAHLPFSDDAARELLGGGGVPLPIHNNCSGKHAGMLALAVAMGWDPEDYHRAEHPVQRRMLAEICRWSGLEPEAVPTGVDGCGVVCFAASLEVMAAAFARFASSAARGEGPEGVVSAMTAHPFMVGGTGRVGTAVMEAAGGRLFVKLGAEGVYCGGVPERGLGFVVKVEDGARRAVDAALIRVVDALDVVDGEGWEALAPHGRPVLRNTREEEVGEIRVAFELSVDA